MRRVLELATLALAFVLSATPSWAPPPPTDVPEPATMSLFGVGVAAAYVANRIRRRKK